MKREPRELWVFTTRAGVLCHCEPAWVLKELDRPGEHTPAHGKTGPHGIRIVEARRSPGV